MSRSKRVATLALPAVLTVSCSVEPSAPDCDDGDVEDLVAEFVRDRLATAAPFHYALSTEMRASLEDRVEVAAKRREDAIWADQVSRGKALAAGDAAYREAIDARQARITRIEAARAKEEDALEAEKKVAFRQAYAVDGGFGPAVEEMTAKFRRKERALSDRFAPVLVREREAVRKEGERAKKAAYGAAHDKAAHDREILVAADELRSAESELADARRVIRERAMDDALKADVELGNV